MTAALIVLAFGRGERFGADKLWVDVGGRPLIAHTLTNAAAAECFAALVVAAPRQRWEALRSLGLSAGFAAVDVVEGGERRQDSVASALTRCDDHDVVCVHDGARPLASPRLYREVVAAAESEGAAIAAVPCVDTIKQVADGHVVQTVGRKTVMAAQTPQAFARDLLQRAHDAGARDGADVSDDAMLVEHLGARVAVVPGEMRNLKVTRPEDLALLHAYLNGS